jgi:hypothetical protein
MCSSLQRGTGSGVDGLLDLLPTYDRLSSLRSGGDDNDGDDVVVMATSSASWRQHGGKGAVVAVGSCYQPVFFKNFP